MFSRVSSIQKLTLAGGQLIVWPVDRLAKFADPSKFDLGLKLISAEFAGRTTLRARSLANDKTGCVL